MRERSRTTKGFASLQGCMIFCKDKICWVIKHTRRADCGQEIRNLPSGRRSLSRSLSLVFFLLPSTWVFQA